MKDPELQPQRDAAFLRRARLTELSLAGEDVRTRYADYWLFRSPAGRVDNIFDPRLRAVLEDFYQAADRLAKAAKEALAQ